MIIIGAGGLAKEILQILQDHNHKGSIYFYDDINNTLPNKLYDKYRVISSIPELIEIFDSDTSLFALGLGNPKLRQGLCMKFELVGGILSSVISGQAYIGKEGVELGLGCNIMAGAKISNGVKLGKAVLVYYNVIITHDVEVGDFVELSPGCILLGHSKIGDYCHIGAGAVILPNVKIGPNSKVGAGSIVTKDVAPNTTVIGIPAKEMVKKI